MLTFYKFSVFFDVITVITFVQTLYENS